MPENMELSHSLLLMAEMQKKDAKFDISIDGTTAFCVSVNGESKRESSVSSLSIHIIVRPLKPKDPINRNDLISPSKLTTEVGLCETKILFRWQIYSRTLIISLPERKFLSWTQSIYYRITVSRT